MLRGGCSAAVSGPTLPFNVCRWFLSKVPTFDCIGRLFTVVWEAAAATVVVTPANWQLPGLSTLGDAGTLKLAFFAAARARIAVGSVHVTQAELPTLRSVRIGYPSAVFTSFILASY